VDAVTQINPGDLFDFDFEVGPLVDVLVGRTLEQSLKKELTQSLPLQRQSHRFLSGVSMLKQQTMLVQCDMRNSASLSSLVNRCKPHVSLWRNAFAAMQPSETAFQVVVQLALCAA
jgi:hypothetical protein